MLRNLDLELPEDAGADLLPHAVHIIRPAGVALCPDHVATGGVREFSGDGQPAAVHFHRA